MATSYKRFLIELYEEYLSDGSFVAMQRKNLLADPCGKWGLIGDWEDRLEAYIDGLSVGGDLALDVCRRRAIDGDPGEFQLALQVFCRASRVDLIERVVMEVRAEDEQKVKSIAEGLCHERLPGITDIVRRLLLLDGTLLPILAKVIGYQRLSMADVLLKHAEADPAVIWALGRLREGRAAERLRSLLRTAEGNNTNTVLALLRIEGRLYSREHLSPLAYGLTGNSDGFRELVSNTTPDFSLALGQLGLAMAIPILVSRLPQPEAAVALQLITGAGLMEEMPIEYEDLEPGERQTTVTKLATDPAAWKSWWDLHQHQFKEPVAYRSGLPYSVERLCSLLTDPAQMHLERYWNAEQLTVRHGRAVTFEADMLASHQLAALRT